MGDVGAAAAQVAEFIGAGGTDAVFFFTPYFFPDQPEGERPSPVDAEIEKVPYVSQRLQGQL